MSKYLQIKLLAQDIRHWLAARASTDGGAEWASWTDEERVVGFPAAP